jgi:tRNA threonylcarbamoyladenosine biosynthesis protein TsaB
VITLALEASTYAGSVCVARLGEIVAARDVAMRDARSERLMPSVAATLADAGLGIDAVDRIVCGAGPGSFTSLRIAAAISKGLALAAGCPLFAVSSLALMVGATAPSLAAGEYVAVLDALRGEAYTALCVVNEAGQVVDVGPVTLLPAQEVDALARSARVLVGERRPVPAVPHARGVARVEALLERHGPADLAGWQPDYGRVAEAQRRWEATHGRALPRA